MIDHINLHATNLERGKQFYTYALKSVGYAVLMESDSYCGIGPALDPNRYIGTIWLSEREVPEPLHIAFRVNTRQIVDQFFEDAMQAGGTSNGEPGLRNHYHSNYYSAFVLDPDGHNIEVVCHDIQS